MHIKHILLGMSIVSASMSFLGIKAVDSIQTIEVVNNSSKTMNITTNNTDSTLHIHQIIPSFTKSLALIHLTQIKSLQDMLFEAILNNSADEIRRSIQAGANVNLEKDGKRPLFWAVFFQRVNAIRCLIENGAV